MEVTGCCDFDIRCYQNALPARTVGTTVRAKLVAHLYRLVRVLLCVLSRPSCKGEYDFRVPRYVRVVRTALSTGRGTVA